jgi:3-oxoadipate enol-lactonase
MSVVPKSLLAAGIHTVRVNEIDVLYEIEGEGPWVVLSHSLACDRTMWDEQFETLAKAYRVVRYDTRGHGGSSAPQGPYTLELLAEDLRGLLDALHIERPHFVGLSMGGMIGQTFAVKYPSALRTLTLCDTTSMYPPGAATAWEERIRAARSRGMPTLVESTLARWFTEGFRKSRPDVMTRFSALISATPVDGYIGCSQALVKINLTTQLKLLDLPALIVVGEHDPGTPVAMAKAIHEHLPNSRLAVIPGAAHISNVEQAEEFTRLLVDFLKNG